MADYRELLRRAVDALPENNGTSRRAVYEKAREALVTQLRAIEPPLPAREITQHRLTLEDCIRQVEQEATEALLMGLKQQTEPPVEAEVEPEPAPTPPAEKAPAPAAEIAPEVKEEKPVAEPEQPSVPKEAAVVEPALKEDTALETEAESTTSDLAAALQESSTPTEEVVKTEQPPVKEEEKQAESAKTDAPTPAPVTEEKPAPQKEAIDSAAVVDETEAAQANAPTQSAEKADEGTKQEPTVPAITSPKPEEKPQVTDEPVRADDADKPEPIRNSIDDVIAAAQAASSAAAIVAPKVDVQTTSSEAGKDATVEAVQPALSSVREVEVDEVLTANAISVDGDEPQATIDRAIKALDLEAEGKETGSKSDEQSSSDDDGASKQSASDTISVNPFDDLSETQIVEDEETGGNGLLVFLLLVVLLLAGAGGGAYWAWKEGFVDLNPLMNQLGLGQQTSTVQTPEETDAVETPTPEETNVQSNVRDVSPTTSAPELTAPTTEEPTPAETQDTSSEPDAPEQLTPEPIALTPEETDQAPTSEEATSTDAEPSTPSDERLSADQTDADVAAPQLNVGDTNASPAEVGSRSLLIEEQLSGNSGAVPFSGETIWSRDVDELGSPVIKAFVSVPARNLTVDVLFRKNSDPALPASHLVEVNFSVTDSFLGGGIASLPGILLKDQELAQGTPLVGASARIFDNSFLFALSASEADLAKNLALISERGWVDLPVVYSTGRKAIVTMEKGKEGGAIFEAVLAAWATE